MFLSSKFACVLTVTLFFAVTAVAKPKLEKELRRAFVGKTYTLKSTCPKSVLNFNAAGEITDDCRPGNWALYSAFHIDGISWSENKLAVSGTRLIGTAVAADTAVGLEIPDPYRLVLNFQLSAPLTDVPSGTAVITRAFESEEERAAELAAYVALFQAVPILQIHKQPAKALPSPCGEDKTKPIGMLGPDRPVYATLTDCPGDENPKVLEAPDPAYPGGAREVVVSGDGSLLLIVVNERGRPEVLKIARRLGYGLEENAIKKVAAWKFDPAKLAGKPVAVALWVQFSSHVL